MRRRRRRRRRRKGERDLSVCLRRGAQSASASVCFLFSFSFSLPLFPRESESGRRRERKEKKGETTQSRKLVGGGGGGGGGVGGGGGASLLYWTGRRRRRRDSVCPSLSPSASFPFRRPKKVAAARTRREGKRGKSYLIGSARGEGRGWLGLDGEKKRKRNFLSFLRRLSPRPRALSLPLSSVSSSSSRLLVKLLVKSRDLASSLFCFPRVVPSYNSSPSGI